MGTGKRWKWQLVTWPHSKIPSVRAVFSGRVRGFWRQGVGILMEGCVDSEGSVCENSDGRVYESWVEGVGILAEGSVETG